MDEWRQEHFGLCGAPRWTPSRGSTSGSWGTHGSVNVGIQSNDSTPFSATEERSKQWHSDKKGQQEYDDNGGGDGDDDDDDNDNYGNGDGARKKKKAETFTDSVPPPCKADVQQQQHKASLQRVVTSADMKAKDVDQATPRR